MDGDALRAARAAARAVLDLLLPRACVVCDQPLGALERDVVCGRCWLRAVELPRPRCERCGHPAAAALAPSQPATGVDAARPATESASVERPGCLTAAPGNEGAGAAELPALAPGPAQRPVLRPCQWCLLLPPWVRAGRSACAMPGAAAEQIVHALKYGRWQAVAPGMARRMAALRFPDDVERERAGLVPVPLSAVRLRERGFNQSLELARELSRAWGVPVLDTLLQRTRATDSQTRLTPGERASNVAGAFHARADRDSLRGRHLVLVDDVVTTAATLNACAAALYHGGARILSFVTFGRAPAPGDRW